MYIGIDLGGTNLKAGVLDKNGKIIFQQSQATHASKGLDYVLNTLKRTIYAILEKYPAVESIGVGIPGIIEKEGTVKISPNLPEWIDIPLGKFLQNIFSIPCAIDNDANVAAIAELELGAGKSAKNFLYVTLGTGVGGAIIIDRKLYRGEALGAGEIGHMIIDLNAELNTKMPFRTGVLEEYIGRNQITAFGQQLIKQYPGSLLHKYGRPDPYFVSEAASQNDTAALEIFRQIGYKLGIGLTSALNFLDMRLVIIGGGISLAHQLLLDTAIETIKQRALPTIASKAEIIQAEFSKDAGIVGAALLGQSIL